MTRDRIRLLLTVSEFVLSSQLRNLHDLVSRLDRGRFEVSIGALSMGDPGMQSILGLGVPVFPLRLQPTRPFRRRHLMDFMTSPLRLLRGRFDLVHSLLYQSVFTEALLVKQLSNAKYVFTKSNLEWANHPFQWRTKCKLADGIISISSATTQLLRDRGFEDRAEQIPLGIDTDDFVEDQEKRASIRMREELPQDALVFGCAAQFIEIKDHLTAIKAFESVADANPRVYLLFCGLHHRDEYFDACSKAIAASRHAARIRYLGNMADMPAFYSAIDVFVLPSRFEAFGYVYIEAMSCCKPTIACRAGGPVDIIQDGVTGLLANVSDPDDLAKKMRIYCAASQLVREHGLAGRKRVLEEFSREAMASATQRYYLRLLGRR